MRSGASGISSGTGYLFGFMANKLFLSMLATMTMPGTFWFYSGVALVGAIILYFVLPETEGRSLLAIERHFVSGAPLSPTTSLAPMAHVAAQTALGASSLARFQDHVVSKAPANGGQMDMKRLEGMRLFQKHIDEHRIRLDGHKHQHERNSVSGGTPESDMPQTQLHQQDQQKHQQQMAHVATMSEMTHL